MPGTPILQAVEAFVALLVALAFVALVTRRVGPPYPVALVLFGVAVSLAAPPVHLQVSPQLVLLVLLPRLVFEAAYSLDQTSRTATCCRASPSAWCCSPCWSRPRRPSASCAGRG